MARHKTSGGKDGRKLPTGARLVTAVAVTAAGAGVLAAVLIPAGGHPGLHEDFRAAHTAATRPAAAQSLQAAPAADPRTGAGAARQPAPAPVPSPAQGGGTAPAPAAVSHPAAAGGTSAAQSPAALIARADAQQKQFDSTAPSEVLKLVNQARAQAHLAPMKLDTTLDALARRATTGLSSDGAAGPAGPVPGTPWQQPGTTDATAIVSRNEVGAQAAVDSWLNDPGERAHVLDPSLRTMGVSSATTPATIWWAGYFGA
ncbi:CAP domain-containing protein [Streptomyces sp. IBSNAI002]|uniref:CAP domain-containing protein n=1 Tax=Streptomyces sp. IBSNAI002 TaxID=3457500 RepID=UPI003FD311B0